MSGAAEGLAGLLDQLCPMHALLDATGHIAHAGPTLAAGRRRERRTGRRPVSGSGGWTVGDRQLRERRGTGGLAGPTDWGAV